MSFGAMAAWQGWLLLLAAGALAAWLFFRKVRPPRVAVPSLLLWQRVLDQSRALSWWERVRRAVSLVGTIVLAVALAIALVRPEPAVIASAGGRMLIVLDSSWSMLAKTSSGRTRWARAQAQARALAASAAGDLVTLATTADGVIEGPTADVALIETAIDRAVPSGGEETDWPRVTEAGMVHFVTDGSVGHPHDPATIVHSVYESAPNVAITAFEARPAMSSASTAEAYLEIVNYATAAQKVRVTITRGTTSLFDQPIDLAAGEAIHQSIPIRDSGATGDARLQAKISASSDNLAIDDVAVASVAGAQPMAVTVVSDDPAPLTTLLSRFPFVQPTFVTTAAYRAGSADAVIFDRWLPPLAPSQPALFIAPPAASWLGKPGAEEKQPRWMTSGNHPVVQGVDALTVDIKRAHTYDGDGLEPIARSVNGTPLVVVLDRPDRRFVVLTFGFADSNLTGAPAFPVLMANTLEWLARPADSGGRRPGWISLPASTTRLTAPDGKSVPLTRVGTSVAAPVTTPGFYVADAAGSHRLIAVNIGDPQVSNLARTTLAAGTTAADGAVGFGRPWWLYALGLAFALAAGEWWTWQRRITV